MRTNGFPIDYEGPITCRICQQEQPHTEFYARVRRRRTECRTCIKAKAVRSAQDIHFGEARWLGRRNAALRRKYGITHADFEAMAAAQDGKCAICGKVPEMRRSNTQTGRTWTALVVDHCHTTDRVRGLLCLPCNTVLGRIERIGEEQFIAYLTQ